jgi:RND family efflux transporter MFP subunit
MSRLRMVAVLAAVAIVAGCKKANQYVAPPPPKVTVAPPVAKKVVRYLEATGNITAIASVDLVARVQGFLQEIHYQDGAFVKTGDILFTVEPLPYQARLQQTQAAEAGAKAQAANTEATFQRQSELQTRQVASVQNLDDARGARDLARANLAQAEANTKIAAINYAYTRVLAPFDGRVTAHLASVGSLVGVTPAPLATLVQLNPIQVSFTVNEQDVQRIRADMLRRGVPISDIQKIPVEVGLQSETGYPHVGHLDYVSPTVDSGTGTIAVRGVLDNADLVLLPGYFVRIRVPRGGGDDALLVPDVAVGADQGGRYVLVVGADNVVTVRHVTVGPLDGALRVIETGLTPDDKVIVSGLQRVSPGQTVEPQSSEQRP